MSALAKDPAARWQTAEDFAGRSRPPRPTSRRGGAGGRPGHGRVRARAGAARSARLRPRTPTPTSRAARRASAAAAGRRSRSALLVLALIGADGLRVHAAGAGRRAAGRRRRQLSEARERLDSAGLRGRGRARAQPRRGATACSTRTPTRASRRPRTPRSRCRVERPGPGARCPSVSEPAAASGGQGARTRPSCKVDHRPGGRPTGREGLRDRHRPAARATRVERGSRVRAVRQLAARSRSTVPDVVGPVARVGRDPAQREGLECAIARAGVRRAGGRGDRPEPGGGTKRRQGRDGDADVSDGPGAGRGARRHRPTEDEAQAALRGAASASSVRARGRPTAGRGRQGARPAPGAGAEVDEGRSVIVIVGPLRGAADPSRPAGDAPEGAVRVAVLAGGRSQRARGLARLGRGGARGPGAGRPRAGGT